MATHGARKGSAATITHEIGALGIHSYSEEEVVAFSEHINSCLADDPDLKDILPLNKDPASNAIFEAQKDGRLLCKLINCAHAGTIDDRAINKGHSMGVFKITENQNLCINSAKSIGCQVVNVGAHELAAGDKTLVLGLTWQIIKIQLLSSVSLKDCPELFRLLEGDETLETLLKMSPEAILLRWFNFHLKESGSAKRVKNFGPDVKDSEAYTLLLHQLKPDLCGLGPLKTEDPMARAELMLQNAAKMNCRKFVTPHDVTKGNTKLNLAFVATIFNTCPGLKPLEKAEREQFDAATMLDDDVGDSREERAFRMWLNSLELEDAGTPLYVNHLFEDLRDGVTILKAMEKIKPGVVDPKRVNRRNSNVYAKVENCNYSVDIGKQLKFSLVNVGGKDIQDGNKKLILGLIWQLMRMHVVNLLKGSGGKELADEDLIKWANAKVKASGKTSKMANFQDPTLKSGVFFLDLLAAIEPRALNADLVTPGGTPEECEQNAKYVISVARKLGACVFLLWEDIVEVKPKMLMTLVGAAMHVSNEMEKGK